MKAKIIMVDGVVDTVLGDEEAMQSDLQIEIVDFDKNIDDREVLNVHYESDLQDIPFSITHPEQEEQQCCNL